MLPHLLTVGVGNYSYPSPARLRQEVKRVSTAEAAA